MSKSELNKEPSPDNKVEQKKEPSTDNKVEQKNETRIEIYKIISLFSDLLKDILKVPEVIPIISYESVMEYFVTNRPADSRVIKGAILRQPHSQGQHLYQVFLDSNNRLVCSDDGKPYGRQLVAKKLDKELQENFDDQDLIIVE
jgi:hypothetical protein